MSALTTDIGGEAEMLIRAEKSGPAHQEKDLGSLHQTSRWYSDNTAALIETLLVVYDISAADSDNMENPM